MAGLEKLAQARRRSVILAAIVERAREEATRNPFDKRWLELGLVEQGQTSVEARQRIAKVFDELQGLLNHVALLDLTRAFELLARARIGNRLGQARGDLAVSSSKGKLPAYHERLLPRLEDFQRLVDYLNLLEGHVDEDLSAALRVIKESRNTFAHGGDVTVPPKVGADEAMAHLQAALDVL